MNVRSKYQSNPLHDIRVARNMAHEIAKLLLEHADTFLERTEAIETALSLGMPLSEIETYLDWLDKIQGTSQFSKLPKNEPSSENGGTE